MSKTLTEDALLRIARMGLTALLGLSIVIGIVTTALIALMYLKWDWLVARIAHNQLDASYAIPWLAFMLALIAAISALAFIFLRALRSIVDTVSRGDPFVPLNADRLRNMAWLTLAIQVLIVPMNRIAIWFDAAPYSANVYHNRNGIEPGALILALVLFVLARVFREGARLREDIEGTV